MAIGEKIIVVLVGVSRAKWGWGQQYEGGVYKNKYNNIPHPALAECRSSTSEFNIKKQTILKVN
jgi:hypothetical protein